MWLRVAACLVSCAADAAEGCVLIVDWRVCSVVPAVEATCISRHGMCVPFPHDCRGKEKNYGSRTAHAHLDNAQNGSVALIAPLLRWMQAGLRRACCLASWVD